ncbi:MAG TPA: 8-amino-7-oxononanoate synthase [Thermogutta sp.]|nr:8-amino-7-oxononanoate synthase [Thermogutta sp.]
MPLGLDGGVYIGIAYSMGYPDQDPLAWIEISLKELEDAGLRRQCRTRECSQGRMIRFGERLLLNFGSNDYLGLAADTRLIQAVSEAIHREGWGSGASPLICGRSISHAALESALARFEGTEAALVFPTGFAANSGTIAALVGPGDAVYSDKKNHASLLDGCRLSRADFRVFPHADVDTLDRLLAKPHRHRRRLVVTDGLFSMDGDLAPLDRLVEVCRRHLAMLLVDEAHATGIFGRLGRGVAEHFGVESEVQVRVGTLSKALGSVGGFVVGRRSLIEWLINKGRPYMFSTAPPAAACCAALTALNIVKTEPHRRETVLRQSDILRKALRDDGWNVGASASQIIPIIVGSPERAVSLANALYEQGLFVPAIRPPSVPDGEACLRISVTYHHQVDDIGRLIETLRSLRGNFGTE